MSRSAFETYEKKYRCKQIEIAGVKDFIRCLTREEMSRAEKLDPAIRMAFLIGFASVEEDETPTFPMIDGESDKEYAERMDVIAARIPLLTMAELSLELSKAQRAPTLEKLVKNSAETTT